MNIKYRLTKKIKCPVCGLVAYPMKVIYEPLIPVRAGSPNCQWVIWHQCFHRFKISDAEANAHGVTARKEPLWMKFLKMLKQ